MIFFNKIVFVSCLQNVCQLLQNPNTFRLDSCIYDDRIAINHCISNGEHVVRMWKTKSLFDIWYDDFRHSQHRFVAALDYTIHDDYIKIQYLNVNDGENNPDKLYKLDSTEATTLTSAMIDFMKIKAKEENKPKIMIDVHRNLRIYEKYYKELGFMVTERKAKGNSHWIETELTICDL